MHCKKPLSTTQRLKHLQTVGWFLQVATLRCDGFYRPEQHQEGLFVGFELRCSESGELANSISADDDDEMSTGPSERGGFWLLAWKTVAILTI